MEIMERISLMSNRKLHENMNLSCEIESIGHRECSYRANLSLDEHLVGMLDVRDVEIDFYHEIKELKEFFICAKALNNCLTLRGTAIIESKFSLSKTGKVQICFWISDIFVGSEYAIEQEDIQFSGFSCQFTDTFELFGVYPYKIDVADPEWLFKSATITDATKSMKFDGGYSCFVAPYVCKRDSEYIFSMQGRMNYSVTKLESIINLKEKIRMLELFFEVLCGESVTVLDITMEKKKQSFEYMGLCNYPKLKLRGLCNGLDSKWYPRKSIFKLSDWKDTGKNVIELFDELAKDNLLAMESYKQVLLDEEIGVVTYNKFLKIMQMIEGIMRTAVSKEEKKNFEKQKKKIKKMLQNDEDKEFINKYCFNNGDNFRTCLIAITRESLNVLSCVEDIVNFEELISHIINDRNAYTHASKEIVPVMNIDQIETVNRCYKEFYRIRILKQLNLSDQLICSRFLYNRKFLAAYKTLFGLTITNMDENHNTGEFDDEMSGYV